MTQNKRPLEIKFFILSVILFLIILVAGSAAFILSMQQIITANKEITLSQMLEVERIRLETSVNSEINIALKLANSPLIKRYFSNPHNSELEKDAFEEIASYRQAFLSNSIFWINDTDNYWYNMTLL